LLAVRTFYSIEFALNLVGAIPSKRLTPCIILSRLIWLLVIRVFLLAVLRSSSSKLFVDNGFYYKSVWANLFA